MQKEKIKNSLDELTREKEKAKNRTTTFEPVKDKDDSRYENN